MCGIAGFIGTDLRLDEAMLRRMQSAQKHRGPDDEGIMFRVESGAGRDSPPLRVGMAHNRLSILDLSSAGHQPMSDASGSCWLCYNGEFFNSPSVRNTLKESGISFASTSDSEVLLYLCRERGVEKAVAEVNGMFAFSFYGVGTRELWLCRDRAGQKPLFYMTLEDGSLVYASEIPALLVTGLVPEDMDEDAFDQYWTLGYTAGERTFHRAIRRLRPGNIAVWAEGKLRIDPYWQVTFSPAEEDGRSIDDYIDEFVPMLEDAVRLRLISDVAVGICLSGGIDSALMALMVSRLRADVPAYTIAFEGTPVDEGQHAATVAGHLGLEHRVLNVSGALQADFPAIASWHGEPFGDASSIPMFFLSRMIREHATVALTGDGGDELFAGYHHYREGMGIWARGYLEKGCAPGGLKQAVRSALLWRAGVARGYDRMQRHANDRLKRVIYSARAASAMANDDAGKLRRGWLAQTAEPLAAMQNCDFHVYMTDDVLAKVDRMSMAHALECRSPFMDYRIIEWAARLPTRLKLSRLGEGKVLLREVLARFMPRELFERPKQGFTPPWESWCEGALRRQLREEWMGRNDPWIRKDAVDLLVPEQGPVSPVLSWMAYSYVEWGKNQPRTCQGIAK